MDEWQKKRFDQLYQRYEAPIYTYLSHQIAHYDELADLFQETFVRVWQALSKIPDEERQQRAYIYTIASHICIDARRKKKSQQKLLELYQEQRSSSAPESGDIEEDWIWKHTLQAVLAELPSRFAACFHLYCIDGFKQREIATILGISEKSVSSYLSRGRECFRQIYRRHLAGNETPGEEKAAQ